MATNGISTRDVLVDFYQKPQNVFMIAATLSMVGQRCVEVLGLDCSKYVNLSKTTAVFSGLFGFWDCGGVVKSTFGLVEDIKTVYDMDDYSEKGRTLVREGNEAKEIKPINADMLKDWDPKSWLCFRTLTAVCKVFSGSVLAYGVLNKIGAIQSAPSAKLKIGGCVLAIIGNGCNINEFTWQVKDENGPNYNKIKDKKTTPDTYRDLYNKKYELDKQVKVTFIVMKLLGIVVAAASISPPKSILSRMNKYTPWGYTVSSIALNCLFLKQELESGAKMKQIETAPKKGI